VDQQKAWGSFEVMPRTWCLISALGADDPRLLAVANGYVVTEEIPESDVVPTIQFELPAFEFHEDLPQ